jgi:D-alanyl-D-alanine carboxypeptidase
MKSTILILGLFLSVGLAYAGDCPHKVRIDTVFYEVPSWWCDRAIDTALIPRSGDFMRLPADLCSNGFSIYVKKEAGQAFVKMARKAAVDSIFFKVKSGYRSIAYQTGLYKKYMADGTAFTRVAERIAPPGFSEHHTGRAFDLVGDKGQFGKSKAYGWLKANAAQFGFVESFPIDSAGQIRWEPWHWYYKGVE